MRSASTSGAFLLADCVWVQLDVRHVEPLGAYVVGGLCDENADRYAFSLVNQLGIWVAPDRGVLVWSPVALLLLPARARSWRDIPDWSRSLLVGGLVYTVVGAAIATFTGGDGFYGYRYGLELPGLCHAAFAISHEQG